MTTKPKTRKPPGGTADPIFAALAGFKAREKEYRHISDKLEAAAFNAVETHGKRPLDWILWRNCDAFWESMVDRRREEFLSEPGADREQIETEYEDAKARLAAAGKAAAEWDRRAGIASLRKQCAAANRAAQKAGMRMARTEATTPGGAAAMINYARREYACDELAAVAFRTVARALAMMSKEAA
jgi:hypothetical protein